MILNCIFISTLSTSERIWEVLKEWKKKKKKPQKPQVIKSVEN